MTECVWLSFVSTKLFLLKAGLSQIANLPQHYLRLYIYAFAFQAHVQRSTSTSHDGKQIADTVIFPRGPMGSPDARFILEAIDAAVCLRLTGSVSADDYANYSLQTCLLRIAVDKLHPSGRMASLPWRFFLYFS